MIEFIILSYSFRYTIKSNASAVGVAFSAHLGAYVIVLQTPHFMWGCDSRVRKFLLALLLSYLVRVTGVEPA